MPQVERATISALRVQGLCDGRSIAWRIGWADDTPDGNVDAGRCSAAAEIALPLDPAPEPEWVSNRYYLPRLSR